MPHYHSTRITILIVPRQPIGELDFGHVTSTDQWEKRIGVEVADSATSEEMHGNIAMCSAGACHVTGIPCWDWLVCTTWLEFSWIIGLMRICPELEVAMIGPLGSKKNAIACYGPKMEIRKPACILHYYFMTTNVNFACSTPRWCNPQVTYVDDA